MDNDAMLYNLLLQTELSTLNVQIN